MNHLLAIVENAPRVAPPFYAQTSFWLYFFTFLPFFLTMLIYGIGSWPHWTKNSTGRGIMGLLGALTLVLGNALIVLMLGGDYLLRDAFRVAFVGTAALAGWNFLKNVTVLVFEGRRLRRNGETSLRTEKPVHLDDDGMATR